METKSPTVFDYDGVVILPGSRVRYWDPDVETLEGTVVEITEWDGDVDDDGRTIVQAPAVVVCWDGHDATESFDTSGWIGESEMGRAEELMVVVS